jgi:hypothetical protein
VVVLANIDCYTFGKALGRLAWWIFSIFILKLGWRLCFLASMHGREPLIHYEILGAISTKAYW